ncbi:type II toxin-antitoxin system HipA family toxin [Granulosicoccaceae sp. 1_MG-2023]|nr:type II toxin-antitoxin system HipA family toxin [Granulosicoccaceae sp. 1_MG-2023]
MGRRKQQAQLAVYIGSTRVGSYSREPSGAASFRYAPDWLASERAFPVSLSLPLSDRRYSGARVAGYFDGLLPDDPQVRQKIAARERADSAATFDLLAVLGRDCVGALRFVAEGEDPGDPVSMQYTPLSEPAMAERLAALDHNPLGMSGESDAFRISIAGVQEKTAFLQVDGQWVLPQGATPTSHIFKPAMRGNDPEFINSPWNEHLSLTLCRALGLATADTEVLRIGGQPVLLVTRFDRRWSGQVLYRLPQEDLCQALGVMPGGKYESDGGPGMREVMEVLRGAIDPLHDRMQFYRAQLVFWLLGAIDGHAKNFSLFLTPGGYRLTPLYDVISVAPFKSLPLQKARMAMSYGQRRVYRLAQIQVRHLLQTARACGLPESRAQEVIDDLLARGPAALAAGEALVAGQALPASCAGPILQMLEKRLALLHG